MIFYRASSDKKVGFTASKKVGNAVKRNYCKRQMRAVFLELQDELIDGDYILVAKIGLHELSHEQLAKSIRWAMKRLGCLQA